MTARTFLLALLVLALARFDGAAVAPPVIKTSATQIARWVKDLGSDEFDEREEASKKLRAAGEVAEEALRKAARSKDVEVSRRAKEILSDFKWGVYPETPKKIVDLVGAYQSAAASEKASVLRKFYKAGPAGCRILLKVATAEEDPLVRREVFGKMARELSYNMPLLLESGRFDAVEALLELGLASETKPAYTNYAAYYLLANKLDHQIARWKALAATHPTGKPQYEVLFYLYRARGDLKSARLAAEKAERLDLEESALHEAGDWRALAARPELISTPNALEKMGYRATYARLAGDHKALGAALADLRKSADRRGDETAGPPPAAKALFINDQIAAALALLEGPENRSLRFDVLVARADVAGAFKLVEKAKAAGSEDVAALELMQARILYLLGEKDKGAAIFKRYRDDVKDGTAEAWFAHLVEEENRAGLREQAFKDAVRVTAVTKDTARVPLLLLSKLYPNKKDEVQVVWSLLYREGKGKTADKLFAEARALMNGKAGAKEIAALVATVEKRPRLAPHQMAHLWLVVAEVAQKCKQEASAISCLEKANAAKAQVRLGDLFAANKDYARAAVSYRKAYRMALDLPVARASSDEDTAELALYLQGWALAKGGKTALGKKLVEQAHWLPLGDARARYELARSLGKRGHAAGAEREHDLLRRVGEPTLTETESFYTGEGLLGAATPALRKKDYFRAATAFEQAMMRSLRPTVHFLNPVAHVGVPAMVHRVRAQGLLEKGKVAEALDEIALAQNALPGSIDVAVRLVPELVKRGRKKEAATVFARALAVQEKLARDYPRYASAHNSAAWLSACCGRDLDKGLLHARKAVELVPDVAGYHDTLAEVLFQKGLKKEATAAQKKAVELAPRRAYFRKQLKRIEAGDPKAPRPSEDDA